MSLRTLAGVDGRSVAAIQAIGIAAFVSGRYAQAAAIFAGLEALDPQDAVHALSLGHALAALGRTGEALEAISRYLVRARDRVEVERALRVRAWLFLALGRDVEAAGDLEQARGVIR